MKIIVSFILLFLTVLCARGQSVYALPNKPGNITSQQDSYSISAQVNAPLFFNYTSVDELLQAKVIPNAFELRVQTQRTGNRVFAQLDVHGKQRAFPEGWLSLKLLSKVSAALVSNDIIPLSRYPVQLFTVPPSGSSSSNTFAYDLMLTALKKHVRPDNYDFSITFTMTQP